MSNLSPEAIAAIAELTQKNLLLQIENDNLKKELEEEKKLASRWRVFAEMLIDQAEISWKTVRRILELSD